MSTSVHIFTYGCLQLSVTNLYRLVVTEVVVVMV